MKKRIAQDRYTLVLEPLKKDTKSRIAIVCPKDLWLFNHLRRLKGVKYDSEQKLLTMSSTASQIRSLQRHLKGFGFWIDDQCTGRLFDEMSSTG